MRSRLRARFTAAFALLLTAGLVLAGCDSGSDMEVEPTAFEVTIENAGAPTPLTKSGAFTSPEGSDSNGALRPGDSYQFSFTVGPQEIPGVGNRFSFATMFIQSNDIFYAPQPTGIALFDDGTPIGLNSPVNVTDQIALWDAGTEVDQEPGTGDNQAPRQGSNDTGPDEDGNVVQVVDDDGDGLPDDDGFEYPKVEDGINVTISSAEDDATGAYKFTVTIENVGGASQVNGEQLLISPGAYAAHFDQLPDGSEVAFFVPGSSESAGPIDGIEEIAEDGNVMPAVQSVGPLTGVTVPLSPGGYAVHSDEVQLFDTGEAASQGIEDIAEDGIPEALTQAVGSLDGVRSGGAFTTPDGASNPGPIAPTSSGPNQSYSFTVNAEPGDRLSFATMYIQSNDLFYAFAPEGLPLYEDGEPINGEVTDEVRLYDAGTEVDEEPGTGLTQIIRSSPDTGEDENGNVVRVENTDSDAFLDDDGFNYAQTANTIRVTITPQSSSDN